jgi:hypothetical protein
MEPVGWSSLLQAMRARRLAARVLASGAVLSFPLLSLAGCQAGITSDSTRSQATMRAYETRVSRLQGQVDAQRATLAALTPPPPTTAPTPFDKLWRIELVGPVERRQRVGTRDGLTPVAAHGVFLVAPIAVTNLTERPSFFNPDQQLVVIDAGGRQYSVDARAAGAAYLVDYAYEPSFAPRQPGVSYPDVLVFDVAPAAGDLVLRSKDDSFALALDDATSATASTPAAEPELPTP